MVSIKKVSKIPKEVSTTQIPCMGLFVARCDTAKVFFISTGTALGHVYNFLFKFFRQGAVFPSMSPHLRMVFSYVFGVRRNKFEVLNSVIGFVVINVMNSLFFVEFSSKMVFHYLPMAKNSLSIYVYSEISRKRQVWNVSHNQSLQ